MPEPLMDSRFRTALAREIPLWTRMGMIDEAQGKKLSRLYELDALGAESAKLFSRAIMGFGALLLGGGVLAFVAANWEDLPKLVKVVMLFAALLAFHGTGFWLWQKRGQERLGRALIFAGCLVFGANIGLLAQIFNIQGDTYRGAGAWALGTLGMAWAVRGASSGILALVLAFWWYTGLLGAHHGKTSTDLLVTVFPALAIGLFGTLAVSIPSRRLLGSTVIALFISMGISGANGHPHSHIPVTLSLLAAGWLALAAGRLFESEPRMTPYAALTQAMGWGLVCVIGLILSFDDLWRHHDWFTRYLWLVPALAATAAGVWAIRSSLARRPADAAERLRLALLGGSLGALTLALFVSASPVSTILANLACLAWAGVGISKGLTDADRSAFWSGSILVFLVILARFFEFETSLMLKSLAFLGCGAVTIYAGVRYEAHLRGKEAA
ncbi:MAG TPA: DUF2157 domain-containing protein [Candidatus Ozemobacteraceae bacterium]|nr:DUF2157 domain-containing protein [Candidatus Ozemobacteraceae bacterium]